MKMVRKGTPAIISGSEPLMKPGVCAHDPTVGVIVLAMLRQQSSIALPLQSVLRCLARPQLRQGDRLGTAMSPHVQLRDEFLAVTVKHARAGVA
jgi:hypothetical protein